MKPKKIFRKILYFKVNVVPDKFVLNFDIRISPKNNLDQFEVSF